MASPPAPTGLKALNGKHYILAALTATVAAAVVVTVFSVVLSPARITFSVTKASSHHLEGEAEGLTLTLAANNTSRRAAVRYTSLFVGLANNTGIYSTRASIVNDTATTTTTGMLAQRWHPHGSVATVDAAVSLLGLSWQAFFDGDGTVADATVLVVQVLARARFKVAGIRTRLYDINVKCGPITFEFASQSPGAPQVVGCSPA